MSAVLRPGFLLYVVTYLAMRQVLTLSTDLALLTNMALSVGVGIAVATSGEALATRLRARRRPAAAPDARDDAAVRLVPSGRAC